MNEVANLIHYQMLRKVTKVLISLFLFDLIVAYPSQGYRLYPQYRENSDQQSPDQNDLDLSRLSWDLEAGKNDAYNYDYGDSWNRQADDSRVPNDYEGGQWLRTADDDLDERERERELLEMYYLVQSLEAEREIGDGQAEWGAPRGSDELPNQLIEVSSKRKDGDTDESTGPTLSTTTTERPHETMTPRTTKAAPITSKPKSSTKSGAQKKGQKEVMIMRPATPVKHPFSQSLEQQLTNNKSQRSSTIRTIHWTDKDMNKLKEQLKKLKEELKQ